MSVRAFPIPKIDFITHKVNDNLIKFVTMNKKVGNILKYGASILLALALLYFAFNKVDWSEFWSALKACRWEYVILSMLFGLLAFYLRALRWRELLLPIDQTTSRLTCFNAVNISYAVNMALPRVGEVVRCGYITAHSKKIPDGEDGQPRRLASFDKVLGTAALERSVDIIMLFLVLLVFLTFDDEARLELLGHFHIIITIHAQDVFNHVTRTLHIHAIGRNFELQAFGIFGLNHHL